MTDEANRVSVTVDIDGSQVLVQAVGEFDMATARFLDEVLRREADCGARRFTIDLERVPFMDSAGLQPIVQLLRRRPPVTVTVVNVCPNVVHLFKLHGVESLMIQVGA